MQGRNIKHFRIPDERGNTPLNERIEEGEETTFCVQTRFDIDKFVENLT